MIHSIHSPNNKCIFIYYYNLLYFKINIIHMYSISFSSISRYYIRSRFAQCMAFRELTFFGYQFLLQLKLNFCYIKWITSTTISHLIYIIIHSTYQQVKVSLTFYRLRVKSDKDIKLIQKYNIVSTKINCTQVKYFNCILVFLYQCIVKYDDFIQT